MAGSTRPTPVQLVRAVESFHGPSGLFVAVGEVFTADAAVVEAYPRYFTRFEPKKLA